MIFTPEAARALARDGYTFRERGTVAPGFIPARAYSLRKGRHEVRLHPLAVLRLAVPIG